MCNIIYAITRNTRLEEIFTHLFEYNYAILMEFSSWVDKKPLSKNIFANILY